MATPNPYADGTKEHHAWHKGYEGLIFFDDDEVLCNIYDTARQQCVTDCLSRAATDIVREVEQGHVYFKLTVNGHVVFKSMLSPVVEKLKEELDKALCMP